MIRVDVEFSGSSGGPYYSSHHFGGAGGQPDADLAVAAVAAFWGDVDAHMSNTCAWSTLADVPDIDPATGQITAVYPTTPAGGAGTVSGPPVPFANQALIRWRTGVFVGGRQVRGRTFCPGMGTGNQENGKVGAALVVALDSYAQDLIDAMVLGNDLVVYSPTHAQMVDVASASTWNEWAVLRSRRD